MAEARTIAGIAQGLGPLSACRTTVNTGSDNDPMVEAGLLAS